MKNIINTNDKKLLGINETVDRPDKSITNTTNKNNKIELGANIDDKNNEIELSKLSRTKIILII